MTIMMPRALAVALILAPLVGGAWAQTPPAIPPASPPQIAPRPAAPEVTPAPAGQLQSEFAVAAGDSVLFAYQSNDLTPRSLKILDSQAKWLKAHPEVKVTLEAYCDDDIDAKQAREFCLTRARTVRDYLVKQGVAADRISLVAFDDTRAPRRAAKADNKADKNKAKKDEKARRTNRRVSTRVST